MNNFENILDDAIILLKDIGIGNKFFESSEMLSLVESANIISSDNEEAFCNENELSVFLLEGMISIMKEKALEDNDSGFYATPDGRLITSVSASQDGLQEEALNLIQSARGGEVIDIYQEILQEINLHCPTCSCDTEIMNYEEVIEKRESYLNKLKDVLGKQE